MSRGSLPPLRVGVLGCGAIAAWAHLPALSRLTGARLVGAADPDPAARARAARWTPAVHATPDELLARRDVEAVVVAVPPGLNAELVEAACSAGKHVYLEKPLAVSLSAAERIAAAAQRAGVTVALGFNRRLHPTLVRARAALAEGLVGPVRAVQSRFCETPGSAGLPEWRRRRATGGGVLLDLASHHADLLWWLLGAGVVAASARLRSDSSEHDSAWVRWTLEGGAEVQSYFSYRTPGEDWIAFSGERGTLIVDRHRFALSLDRSRPGRYGTRRTRSLPGFGELLGRCAHAAGHVYEPSYRRSLAAFAASVRAGGAAEPATLGDGMRALRAVLAAEAAAA